MPFAYELNIGLDRSGGPNEPWRREQRVAVLKQLLDADDSAVIGDLEGADEPCLWGRVSLSGGVALVDLCWSLCEEFGQDCIAVLFDDSEGALLGPRTEAWGEFNRAYFRRPEYVEN